MGKGAGLRWRPLPKAEAPTEPGGEKVPRVRAVTKEVAARKVNSRQSSADSRSTGGKKGDSPAGRTSRAVVMGKE